jgi:GNAT superfamily N-acetyltransferase
MHIRRAHESEAPLLSALAYESKAYWSYSVAQLEAWRGDLTVSPSTVSSLPAYVAEAESGIAGFFVLLPSSPHWKLEHFWVAPSSMGQGVGKALLSHAAALAAEGGATALAIDADPNAESFYLACGAKRVGSLAAPIEGSPDRERPQLLLFR